MGNLDCYTQYEPLTSKARFWGNFVSALKGMTSDTARPQSWNYYQDLRLQRSVRQPHPPCPHLLPLHSGGSAPGRDEAEARVWEAGGSDVEKQAGDLPPSHSGPSRGKR